jgi:hypothetical protein
MAEIANPESAFAMTATELLESVRRVEARTNRLVNDTMGGAYLSGFKESHPLTGLVGNVKSSS